jgi:hypothetical protein
LERELEGRTFVTTKVFPQKASFAKQNKPKKQALRSKASNPPQVLQSKTSLKKIKNRKESRNEISFVALLRLRSGSGLYDRQHHQRIQGERFEQLFAFQYGSQQDRE